MRLDSLTPEQAAILPAVRDEWIAHGLSCEPADRDEAKRGVASAYRAAGLEPPSITAWLASPLAGCIGTAMLREVLAQVGEQVGAQVGDEVWDQVGDQVGVQVRDQVGDQVWGQVGAQVRGQVRDQVGDEVWGQVWDQVGEQVGEQVRGQVGAQVWAQVRGQVRDQVGDEVWGQVWDQVGEQVRGQVGAQVGDQIWDQVRDQVGAQVGDQIWDQVWASLLGQHDASWLGYLDAYRRLGLAHLVAPLDGLTTVARSAGWWWPLRGAAILTDRPAALHRDDQGRLHRDGGLALRYGDGWGVPAWHGTRVPAWIVTDDLTVEAATAVENIEHRRCAIERLGWDRLTDTLTLADSAADPGNPGQTVELYDVPQGLWGDAVRVVLATNGTPERDGTRRRYGITVPADMPADALTAAAWTYRLDRDTYATLQRRT